MPTIQKIQKTDEIPCAVRGDGPVVQRQMPIIQKTQKTVEILQVQFEDEVVNVNVVIHDRCL